MVEAGQVRVMSDGTLVVVDTVHYDEPVATGSSYRVTLRLQDRPDITFDRRYLTVATYPLYESIP